MRAWASHQGARTAGRRPRHGVLSGTEADHPVQRGALRCWLTGGLLLAANGAAGGGVVARSRRQPWVHTDPARVALLGDPPG